MSRTRLGSLDGAAILRGEGNWGNGQGRPESSECGRRSERLDAIMAAHFDATARPEMPINPDALNVPTVIEQHIDTRWLLSYAAGLGLTDPLYLDDSRSEGAFVVPMFCVCPEWEVVLRSRSGLGMRPEELRMGVHAWQHSAFIAPFRPGMDVLTTSRVVHMRRTSAGTYLVTRYETCDKASGALLVDSHSGTMFRGVSLAHGERFGETLEPAPTRPLESTALQTFPVFIDPGFPHVYTECARIWNPIHTEERVAKAAGLGGILLHGTATWALAAKAVAEAVHGPQGLRRMRVLQGQFRRPVLPRDTISIRLLAIEGGGETVDFDVLTGSGEAAMSGGRIVFAADV
jgi:acyl dehydratase